METPAHPVTPPLDAVQSDPRHMAWMVGTPPPLEKRVRFEDASMLRFPQNRWANSNFRSLVPTKVISRGHGPVAPLVRAESFFRYQIMIRYRAMTRLSQVLSAMEASLNLPEDVHLVMDVDPVNLM